jgi:hypothetical protein
MVYNGENASGPRVLMDWLLSGSCQYDPPLLVPDALPPDMVRPLSSCSSQLQTTAGAGVASTCTVAFSIAKAEAQADAESSCTFGVCSFASYPLYCGNSGTSKVALASYDYYCFDSYNLCQ